MSPYSLEGRRAIVTGSDTGIGQAIAVSLAAQGARVTCAGVVTAAETVKMIADAGGTAETLELNVTDRSAVTAAMAGAGYTILVNNAGLIRREDSVDFSEKDWDDVMDVNVKAVFFTSQAFAKEAFSAGTLPANIINIASLLSFQGGIRVPSYTASKHGVAGLTKIFANEWAEKGLNVNAIAPGYIATNNTAALRADPERSKAILERIPAGRWGEPSDIGGTAAFLCSEAARYIHGAVLSVDGGWLAR